MMYRIVNNSELFHYGIKGQRWDLRRFQNTDGTYTEEGLERKRQSYGSSSSKKTAVGVAAGLAGAGIAIKTASDISKAKGKRDANTRQNLEGKDKAKISPVTSGIKEAGKGVKATSDLLNDIGNFASSDLKEDKISKGIENAEKIFRIAGDAIAIAGTISSIISLTTRPKGDKDDEE